MKKLIKILCLVVIAMSCCVVAKADDESTLATKIANKQQLTDVPTIYLTIPDVTDIEKDLVKDRTTNTAAYHDATIQVVDNSTTGSTQHLESFSDAVQIKVRGNSTADAAKKPFRLKFAKDEKDASGNVTTSHKHDLLGYGYSARNWVLMANYYDRSMIRNALTYHLGKYLGMPFCPGYKFVDLVINDEYRGTYQVSDQIEAGKNRVAIDEDNDWMIETVSWTNMLDPDYGIAAGTASTSDKSVTLPYNTNVKNPEPATTDDWTTLKEDVITWESAWNKSFQSSSKTTGWQAYNDVETFIKFYLAMNITYDYDGFFVMKGYRTPDGPFYWGPIWDKDLAYGNYVTDPEGGLTEDIENGMFHWNILNYLQKDKTFVSKVKEAFDQLEANDVCTKLCNDVDNLSSLIDQSQSLNYTKWSLTEDCGIGKCAYSDYSQHKAQLKEFLTKRFAYLKTQFDTMYKNVAGSSEEGDDGDEFSDAGGDGWERRVYNLNSNAYLIPASAINSDAESIKISISGNDAQYIYARYNVDGSTSEWSGSAVEGIAYSWGQTTGSFTITDATTISNAQKYGITIFTGFTSADLAVTCYGTNIQGTTPICTHDYSDTSIFSAQSDGTYHAVCSKCKVENTTDTYYCFTVYPESATTETVYAKSWTPSADHPNSIASVKITSGLEAQIPNSYNVYNNTKNADGDQVCPDFRLTDSHPYYSANKFVATKATYTRSLGQDEEYGTIILPYKYQSASNDYASFYHIASVSDNTMTLKAIDPETEGDASAYTPVIFKRKNGTTTLTVEGTNITVKKSSADMSKSTVDGWTLYGVVSETTKTSDGLYQISDSKNGEISKVSSVTVTPFRAYLESTDTNALSSYNIKLQTPTIIDVVNAIKLLPSGETTKDDVEKIVNAVLGK